MLLVRTIPVSVLLIRIAYPVPAVSVIWFEEIRLLNDPVAISIPALAPDAPLLEMRLLLTMLLFELAKNIPFKVLLSIVFPVN